MALPTSTVNVDALIEQSRRQSVQSDTKLNSGSGFHVVDYMVRAGEYIPSWWSTARDKELRRFWKKSDHLSGAIYAMESKMTAIPCKVVARDPSIHEHVQQADFMTEVVLRGAEFGRGWANFFAPFVEDMLTQDNGAFGEILGAGPKTGPIVGAPFSVAHLDSARCQRTGNIEYPVIYRDENNDSYKLHYSRVMFTSQMASPIREMYGVGFCAVSRAINVTQTLIDILIYKQEKLGSRPMRELIITQGGLAPEDLAGAFQLAARSMDNQGLSRYAKIVLAGLAALPDAAVQRIPLSELPDGFDEETSITLGMAAIALALGVDARELFPAMSAGATRADALLAHIKQRGKGPGQIIQTTELLFDAKFLPPHLAFQFDFQDDEQDRQQAEIRNIRAEGTERNINTGALNTRVSREQMLENGDITKTQFEYMELEDGRLSDGTSVLTLFYKTDPAYKRHLNMGIPDPLDIFAQDPVAMSQVIIEKMQEVSRFIANATNLIEKHTAVQCLFALAALQKVYQDPQPDAISDAFSSGVEEPLNMAGDQQMLYEQQTPGKEPASRDRNPAQPNPQESNNPRGRNGLRPSTDDR